MNASVALPHTLQLPTHSEGVFRALWSIRNLSGDTQKTYSKMLRRPLKYVDLEYPEEVEGYIFNQDTK